ncbi:hypothetical protein Fot_24267 [Forsythia ovata]|uniref:Uncharacterized protein n=1 Tax=Forsythia ovata TaxID=205694 RepID=A0ABD1U5R9_9LAMI
MEILEIVVSKGGEIPRRKRNRRHKKMPIAQTNDECCAGGRAKDEKKGRDEARAPAISHSHPYSDHWDSRRYQPIDPLKERERRSARSDSVFNNLVDEAYSHQRRAQFCYG